jgi:Flp pilus assembly pilin Flp
MRPLFRHLLAYLSPFAPARRPRRKKGQTLVEYALILALVAVACIAAFNLLGKQVITIFSAITTLLDTSEVSH